MRADNSPHSTFSNIFQISEQSAHQPNVQCTCTVYMRCTDLNSSCTKTGSPNIGTW